MIWAIVQLSTKETQFFCVMKIIDGGVLPEFPIEEFGQTDKFLKDLIEISHYNNYQSLTFFNFLSNFCQISP